MPPLAHELLHCILCRSADLQQVVPLRGLPIATPVLSVPQELRASAETYAAIPLNLNLCRACGQLQVSHVPDVEFEYRNYVYRTSMSLNLREHFEAYAKELTAKYAPPRNGLVVEVGSNDGTLLRNFQVAGMRVLGIDPATSIAMAASGAGIETLGDFFSLDLAKKIRAERGAANVVIANFVTANIEDMVGFADGVKVLLAPDGIVSIETQYGADVIEQNLLDTIYHEHLSYYFVTPLVRHYARHGLEVVSVKRVPTKGGSIRLLLQHTGGPRTADASVAELVADEERKGATSPSYYAALPAWIDEIRNDLAKIVQSERAAGRSIAGWGVSVGTSALMPQFDLTKEIDFLVDDDPEKEPVLKGPGYEIPVVTTEEFYRRSPGAVIVFAWRYIAPIMQKHRRYLESGGKFVVPLPHVSVVSGADSSAPNTISL